MCFKITNMSTHNNNLNILFALLLILLILTKTDGRYSERFKRPKRQVSLDDIIQTALHIVKPIFDTSQPLLDSATGKKVTENEKISSSSMRESNILGMEPGGYSSLSEVPICRNGNSRICQFISCTAHNFKNDQNFANLNLAAQVIGDQQLRKTIGSNPEAITAVCHEQGLSMSQCQLFSRGFQLIDRFMTTIEKPETKVQPSSAETEIIQPPNVLIRKFPPPFIPKTDLKNSTNDKISDPFGPLNDDENDQSVKTPLPEPIKPVKEFSKNTIPQVPLRPINEGHQIGPENGHIIGSRTWSTRHINNDPTTSNTKNSAPKNVNTNEKIINYNFPSNQTKASRNVKSTTSRIVQQKTSTASQINYRTTTKPNITTTTFSTLLIKKRPTTTERIPRATLPPVANPIDADTETVMPTIRRRPYSTATTTQQIEGSGMENAEEHYKTVAQLDALLLKTISEIPEAEEEDSESSKQKMWTFEGFDFNQDETNAEEKKRNQRDLDRDLLLDKRISKRAAASDDYYDELEKKMENNNSVGGSKNSLPHHKATPRINCMQYLG